jgi:hypothetical protein
MLIYLLIGLLAFGMWILASEMQKLKAQVSEKTELNIPALLVAFYREDNGAITINCCDDEECTYRIEVDAGKETDWFDIVNKMNGHYCPIRQRT